MPSSLRYACLVTSALVLTACTIRPDPLSLEQVRRQVEADTAVMFSDQEPMAAPITLADAMARALKYNMERRLSLMETTLANKQLTLASYDLLPKVAASAGWTLRDRPDATSSKDAITEVTSSTPSYSSERNRALYDVGLSWNVLDFGVSYVRARQQADRVLIAEERRRKVVQNLMQDVRYAFWRAVAAERLLPRTQALIARVEAALERSRQIQGERLASPADTIAYRRELLDLQRKLEQQRDQLSLARTELATLMNVKPGSAFSLAVPDSLADGELDIVQPTATLERLALVIRPELMGERYQARIGENESYAAILSLLPGVNVAASRNWDSNTLLMDNRWHEFSAKAAMNLVHLASLPDTLDSNDAREAVDEARRRALSVAVVTQVNLSLQSLGIARKELSWSKTFSELEDQSLTETRKAAQARTGTEMAVVRAEAATLGAELAVYKAYAEVQRASAQVETSIGLDPVPGIVDGGSLGEIAKAVERQITLPLSARLQNEIKDKDVLKVATRAPAAPKEEGFWDWLGNRMGTPGSEYVWSASAGK